MSYRTRGNKMVLKMMMLALTCICASAAVASPLTGDDRALVIRNAASLLEERYVKVEEGARLANELRASEALWQHISDGPTFAADVTTWLRERSGDGHLGLSYSATPIAEQQGEVAFSKAEMERWYGAHLNHGVERIERLEDNIMLLDLRVFPPAEMGGDVIAAAMNVVAQGDALILDLRRNGGGSDTANLVIGYLLGEANQPLSGIYNRPQNRLNAKTSPAWVPGRRFGGAKPLFILTSNRTFSAAEAVAYDLQALGRAVIVGERTGGGAHPYEFRRVHSHFALDLPEGQSINPITGGNWQGTGVVPDIEVPASEALEQAVSLAKQALSFSQ
jgi:hypothetical protein